MWYEVLIPAPVLMIPILVMTTKGTHSTNDSNLPSDVIVTYSNHAEANHNDKILTNQEPVTVESTTGTPYTPSPVPYQEFDNFEVEHTSKIKKPKKKKQHYKKPEKEIVEEEEPIQEDVVFIPNERDDRVRNEYYLQNEHKSLGELMGGHKTMEDVLAAKDVRLETESPVTDIVFVMGKNNENLENTEKRITEQKKWQEDRGPDRDVSPLAAKLNCSNLNCNNSIDSVCGEKMDDNYQLRRRLFLNECYFRKVNCNFKDPTNRFKKVLLNKCRNSGVHTQAPFSFSVIKPMQNVQKAEATAVQFNRTRQSSSRRSMTTDIHGQFCSHPCPASCPELYAPECAVSSTGRYRVFVNHCALDHNSCSFGIVWHSVPLSECVGGKKATMRQNAGFVGWMQRVGIVDNRGRLAYNMN